MTWKALLVLGLGVGLLAGSAGAQESLTLRKIKATGIVTVGYQDGSIPFSYLDQRQQPVGYSIDICTHIVDAVRARLNMPDIEIKFTPVTSANRISFLENDIVDMVCGSTTNNAERQKRVAFTLTTFVATNSMVSRKTTGIRSLDDLRGQTVVTSAGTTSIALLANLNRSRSLDLNILVGKDHVDSFRMVATDRATAFVMDDVLLHGLVASAKNPSDYRIQPTGLSVEPYGVVLRKNDAEFKKIADSAIAGLFKSGEIGQVYARWFLAPIPPWQINLALPMNRAFKRLIAKPTDSADPAAYQ
jgi:glutamate/aspartate transport system substrate-binding protein